MQRIGVDTNVLVYAHLPAFPQHPSVRNWMLDRLRDGDVQLVVTPLVLHEFVHVVTDPRRFTPSLTTAQAIAVGGIYLSAANVTCAAVDDD